MTYLFLLMAFYVAYQIINLHLNTQGSIAPPETESLVDLSDVGSKTGTGDVVVFQNTPTITTPTIAQVNGSTTSGGKGRLRGSSHAQPGPYEVYVTHDTNESTQLDILSFIRDFAINPVDNPNMGCNIRFYNKKTDGTLDNYFTIIVQYDATNNGAGGNRKVTLSDIGAFQVGGGSTSNNFNVDLQGVCTARTQLRMDAGTFRFDKQAAGVMGFFSSAGISGNAYKTLIDSLGTISFGTDATATAVKLDSVGITGIKTFTFPNSATTPVLVTEGATQTLSAKTLSSAILSGIVTGTYTIGGVPTLGASLTIGDGFNFILNTTTGSKIGVSVSQKLAFHDAIPVIQRAGAAQVSVATTASTNVSPFGYTTASQADGIITLLNEIRAVLVEKGLMKGAV